MVVFCRLRKSVFPSQRTWRGVERLLLTGVEPFDAVRPRDDVIFRNQGSTRPSAYDATFEGFRREEPFEPERGR